MLKAYRELETKGLAKGRPGQGTFIEATLNQVTLPELTDLRRSLISWVVAADSGRARRKWDSGAGRQRVGRSPAASPPSG